MPKNLCNRSTVPLPIAFPAHSDHQLQVEALATRREVYEQMIVKEHGDLWGYLQPIASSEEDGDPFVDFMKSKTGYRLKIKVPLNNERTSSRKHRILITRGADDQPAYVKNLSNILIVTLNAQEMLKGQSCRLDDGDRLGISLACGTMLYDYVYNDALAKTRQGNIDEHYIPSTLLGRGAFASTYSVVHRETRTYHAAKRIKRLANGPTYEISCLKELRHPNICELKEVFFHHDNTIYLVMDLCRHGTLLEYIGSKPGKCLAEEIARDITFQICMAMDYVHLLDIVHRDLKLENILMASLDPLHIKIADFGLAKSTEFHGLLRSGCGTEAYIAPEIFNRRDQPYDHRVDSWSVGVIVVAMLTGHTPYTKMLYATDASLAFRLSKREVTLDALPLKGYRFGSIVYQFVQSLLTIEPEHRMTLTAALGSSWLEPIVEAIGGLEDSEDDSDFNASTCG